MRLHTRRASTLVVGMATFALLLPGAVPTFAGASGSADDGAARKVDESVRAEVAEKGRADFWVVLDSEADLSGAKQRDAKPAKARLVRSTEIEHANQTQAGLRRLLRDEHAEFESFWITNAILVRGGDAALLDAVAARPEVASIAPDQPLKLPPLEDGTVENQVNGVEWNIDRINAPRAWDEFGVRGEDIVVASIDSGVDYTHAALVGQYWGNNGDGTFTHDYNWFDPASVCPADEPCDNNGHGTHTMGTMVGDDGAGNQIGVAPGATWIAAKGCESNTCSAASLLAAGEWIVAPTDLSGQNPRPDLAPDVVNNSWGGGGGDFWYQDVVDSWVAAGIFPSFSGGNNGPDCGTPGSPGDYPVSYASGAFDIDNRIAFFSSRGPGPNGEVKPNLAAPGVNVRSSVPGGGYGSASGTSMAAPHTTATVALMWSAAPALRGDVAATKEILDQSAIDTPDDQCGGTDADNNVWGEGRLDAYAAVQQSPRGDVGAVSGHVTDDAGTPLAGATVTLDRPRHLVRTTGDDGSYEFKVLVVGDYTVTVEKYGYGTVTDTVTVAKDQTTTADYTLQQTPPGTVHGTVTDGSGHGWPLYAKITIDGYPNGPIYTDPYTGAYTVDLPQQATHTLHITPVLDGYQPTHDPVQVDNADLHHDITAPIDPAPCTTPGYARGVQGLRTQFTDWTGTTPQDGWTITDNAGHGQTWRFDTSPDPLLTPTSGDGDTDYASVRSGWYGGGGQDTSLASPVIDLSDQISPHIEFDTYYDNAGGATVDVSLDGGNTWRAVWTKKDSAFVGQVWYEHVDVPINQASGQSDVQVRFNFTAPGFGHAWVVDNVAVGTCRPVPGGLITGVVTDANTGDPLDQATIVRKGHPEESAVTTTITEDPNASSGFYTIFSSGAGDREITAGTHVTVTGGKHVPSTATVDLAPDELTRQDFVLKAGHLTMSTDNLSVSETLGEAKTTTVAFTNDGTAPVHVDFGERESAFTSMSAQSHPRATLGHPNAVNPLDSPWASLPDLPEGISSNVVAEHDGKVYTVGGWTGGFARFARNYVYDPYDPSQQGWVPISELPRSDDIQGANYATGAFVRGELYLVGGYQSSRVTNSPPGKAVFAYDPKSDRWRRVADLPQATANARVAVLDGRLYIIGGRDSDGRSAAAYRYDRDNDTWARLADYPMPVVGQACAGIAGVVACAGGWTSPSGDLSSATYVYDPGSNSWTRGADMPYPNGAMAAGGGNGQLQVAAGYTVDGAGEVLTDWAAEFDPATDAWSTLPSAIRPVGYGGSTCGFYQVGGQNPYAGFVDRDDPLGLPQPRAEVLPGYDDGCGGGGVPWLSETPAEFDLAVGESVTVTVTMDSSRVSQPGAYAGELFMKTDSPYLYDLLPASMHVEPAVTLGKVAGTVTDAASGDPIAGATVQVCSNYVLHRGLCGPETYTLTTDESGHYQRWISMRYSPLQVIAAKDGYVQQVTAVKVKRGDTTILDFALHQFASVTVTPGKTTGDDGKSPDLDVASPGFRPT